MKKPTMPPKLKVAVPKPPPSKLSKARPTNSLVAPKAKPAPKVKPFEGVPTWYDENGKPSERGLYNRDGAMARTSAPPVGVKKGPAPERERSAEEIATAKRNGFLR